MRPNQTLASLAAVLALSGCGTTSAPSANEQAHVGAVEVVLRESSAPPAFADLVRVAVLQQAAAYGEAGHPITLRIDMERVHFKNALKAMIVGDDNQAKGQVVVVDPATGQQTATFAVQVNADRGISGASIAMTIVGAFDPTGLVDLGTAAGEANSANFDRRGTAAQMSANFAAETLRHTFGDARAKAVAKAAHAQKH
jgi:hypothetical protein